MTLATFHGKAVNTSNQLTLTSYNREMSYISLSLFLGGRFEFCNIFTKKKNRFISSQPACAYLETLRPIFVLFSFL